MSAKPKAVLPAVTELAWAYRRCFDTEDGLRVLGDLKAKFDTSRPRFPGGSICPLTAALIDGQCAVLKEIETAISTASKSSEP